MDLKKVMYALVAVAVLLAGALVYVWWTKSSLVNELNVEKEELTRVLKEALEVLTEKECKVITLYYYEELTLKEISNILEVSESRISQLHTRALQKMKTKMGNYIGILT